MLSAGVRFLSLEADFLGDLPWADKLPDTIKIFHINRKVDVDMIKKNGYYI
ncbi:hypothetical protein B4135_3641 [Caldibacillus debilis]|uniref:Uncharacterized protein n=1 Tax=Caldibacillus debilis TaxID=301148 RepID=A0A150LCU4_9BACI|nr:hypothetical protein B4135_3641 [Caldibacillus debilis]